MLLGIIVLAEIGLGCFGAYVAGEKHRSAAEGFLLGFLFGPLGVLVEALLPSVAPRVGRSRHRDRVAWMPEYSPDWDAQVAAQADDADDQVMQFLNDAGSVPRSGQVIDLAAIAEAEEERKRRRRGQS